MRTRLHKPQTVTGNVGRSGVSNPKVKPVICYSRCSLTPGQFTHRDSSHTGEMALGDGEHALHFADRGLELRSHPTATGCSPRRPSRWARTRRGEGAVSTWAAKYPVVVP